MNETDRTKNRDGKINPDNRPKEIFGQKVSLFSRIIGCWHTRMSKPITKKNTTYRFCPKCGIRRRFDLESFKSYGDYYYPARDVDSYFV